MNDPIDLSQEEWERGVPASITGDVLWRVTAYRTALYVCDTAWSDVTALSRDARTRALADQWYRALGSIGANVAEGYSRGSGRDRVRFFEYALGSAREARDWAYKARHILGDERSTYWIDWLSSVIRLLLVMIRDQRSVYLREPDETYDTLPS